MKCGKIYHIISMLITRYDFLISYFKVKGGKVMGMFGPNKKETWQQLAEETQGDYVDIGQS